MESTVETLNDIRQAARQAFAAGNLSYSIELYEYLIAHSKSEPLIEDIINFGAILRQAGQLEKASEHYNHHLPQFSKNIHLIRNACNCWIELCDFDRSRSVLRKALSIEKDNPILLLALGHTELSSGKTNTACEIFEAILQIDSQHFDAWFNLAVAKAKGGVLEEALVYFRHAQRLQNDHRLLNANIISILQDLNRISEAWTELKKLKFSMRSSKEIKEVEASLLMTEENYAEASSILRDLAQNNPQKASHWVNWSTCLKAMKFTVAPKRILKIALLWHPENIDLQHSFAQSMAEMGELKSYQKTQSCWRRDMSELSNEHIFSRQFLAISSNLNHSTKRNLAQYWESKQITPETHTLWADRISISQKRRRVRIGYLSADWRNHPVGRFMLPILKHHDRIKFEFWCIDSTPNHDWISDQLKQHADHWINIKNLDGLKAARRISDEQLDVLVELGGFTGGSRLDCLVHRPCPIQLSYLGYPAPTFLNCIDGWIGDQELFSTLSTVEREAHDLIFIDGGYMAFDPGAGIPEPNRDYQGEFRFGCFNHARKLTNATIELFCNVLNECPQSTLLLKSISFHEEDEQRRIRKRFAKQGVDPDRLIILDWINGGLEHLACYNMIDAALDPFPYGGATTTAEALWMGVPVITRRGSGMAGCLSSSLLNYGEKTQWIANDQENYLKIAQVLFARGPRNKKDRISLRLDMQRSPVGDAQRLSQELETHYQKLIQHVDAPSH